MSKSYKYDFEQIKRTIPVLVALEMLGIDTSNAKHAGKELSLACPFENCEGKTSFKTSSEKNLWRCFKCERIDALCPQISN